MRKPSSNALAEAEDLAKSFRVDRAGHQERDIANLAGPAALHHDAVEIKIRMLTFDPPVPPGLDLGEARALWGFAGLF